jgi:hypothetical protein
MKNEQTRKRVNEIFAELDVLKEELKIIRKDCSHDSYYVGNWSWLPGRIMQARICNHCQWYIGEPSQEEYETFTGEQL